MGLKALPGQLILRGSDVTGNIPIPAGEGRQAGLPPSRLIGEKWGLVFHWFILPETPSEKWRDPFS